MLKPHIVDKLERKRKDTVTNMSRLLIRLKNGTNLGYRYQLLAFVVIITLFWANFHQDHVYFLQNQNVKAGNSTTQVHTNKFILTNDVDNLSRKNVERDTKTILLWTTYFHKMTFWKKVFTRLLNRKCKINRCKLVTNKKKYVSSADALVFSGSDLTRIVPNFFASPTTYPNSRDRRRDQYYVFLSLEAPTKFTNINLDKFKNYFNWTMTFRPDSDIYVPYGKFHKIDQKGRSKSNYVTETEIKKKKIAIWIASNCYTDSHRENLVIELSKHIPLDIVGKCGWMKCGDRTTMPKLLEKSGDSEPCDFLISNYIYYLSFENSLCSDYVTEKFYRALKHGAIPVVFGGANYSSCAPEHSFIDVRDFNTTEDIADYLQKVATDVTLYNKYHEWRDHHKVEIGSPYAPFICDLCEKLHNVPSNPKPHYYTDLKKWYVTDNTCYTLKV